MVVPSKDERLLPTSIGLVLTKKIGTTTDTWFRLNSVSLLGISGIGKSHNGTDGVSTTEIIFLTVLKQFLRHPQRVKVLYSYDNITSISYTILKHI